MSPRVAELIKLIQPPGYPPAIRPLTVPADAARLRVTLSPAHNVEQIEGLVNALK